MSPVAAVCPVHGAFPSQAFPIANARNLRFSGSGETCPVPGCGRIARVMDGVFNITDGIVTVLSAPGWSQDALGIVQRPLLDAARAAASPQYSDARAYAFVERKLEQIEEEMRGLREENAQQADRIEELLLEIREAQRVKPRSTLSKILYGAWLGISALATFGGAYAAVGGIIEWGAAMFSAGREPQLGDLPPALRMPSPSPGPQADPPPAS